MSTIPKSCKPSKVACKPSARWGRPILETGEIVEEGNEKVLYVTDSYRLVRIPVGNDADPGTVPHDALKALDKAEEFNANGTLEVINGASVSTFERDSKGTYPDCKQLWPADRGSDAIRISFNPKYLYELAQAMGVDANKGITLELDAHNPARKPILVEPNIPAVDGIRGLLMPMRI